MVFLACSNSIRNWAQLEYKFHENKEVYAAEFVWPSKAKPGLVPSLKPIQKNRQEELKFIFDVSKCDRIFDELLKNGNIRLSHV